MSASWDFPRNIVSVVILTETAARYGMDAQRCLAGSGIPLELLDNPAAEVAAEQELRVIRNLLGRLGPELPLGLEAGLRYHPTTYGMWGLALLSAPLARDAVEVGLRYLRLTSIFCEIEFVEDPRQAHFIADDRRLPPDLREFLVERDGAAFASLARDLLPAPVRYTAVELRRGPRRYDGRALELFGLAPRYGQPLNRISAEAESLNRAMPQGFMPTLKYCEMQCRKLLQQRRPRDGVSGQIRRHLRDNPRGMPTMQAMAGSLAIPLRTLRRRLAVEGTDYETLVEETRAALADELLTQTRLPVSDIAEHLGYSEPSCFVRAFTRWNAMSPKRYRESMAGAGLQ